MKVKTCCKKRLSFLLCDLLIVRIFIEPVEGVGKHDGCSEHIAPHTIIWSQVIGSGHSRGELQIFGLPFKATIDLLGHVVDQDPLVGVIEDFVEEVDFLRIDARRWIWILAPLSSG